MGVNRLEKNENLINAEDLFKFLGALAMVTCHCFIFLVRGLPPARTPQISLDLDPHFFLPGLMSMSLPVLAGYGLRKFLKPYLSNGYLLSLKTANLIKLFIGLVFLDALKNGLLFGFEHAFKWDVLAFIVATFLILFYVLKRWGNKGFWILTGINLAVMGLYALSPVWLQLSDGFVRFIIEQPQLVVFAPFSLGLAAIFFWIWNFGSNHQSLIVFRKLRLLAGGLLSLLVAYFVYLYQIREPYFWASLVKLPLSAFIQLGQGGGHIWPLFPWMLLILVGYLFADKEKWIFRNWKNSLGVYLGAQIIFTVILLQHFGSFRKAVAVQDFFSSRFFEPRWQIIFLILTFFISAFIGYHYVLKVLPIRSRFIKLYANGILLFYFIHQAVAIVLLGASIRLFPGLLVYTMYPIVVNIISYFFLAGIYPLFEKHIEIKFVKR